MTNYKIDESLFYTTSLVVSPMVVNANGGTVIRYPYEPHSSW